MNGGINSAGFVRENCKKTSTFGKKTRNFGQKQDVLIKKRTNFVVL